MGILWGFVAAFGWGTADFIARGASIRLGAYRALLYAHLVSFVGLLLIIAWNPAITTFSYELLLLGFVLGGLNTIGSICLYRALSMGKLAVVSPIGSSFAAITLVLSLLSGDQISYGKIAGLVLTVIGVVLASMPHSAEDRTKAANSGVVEALGAALSFGVAFWGLKYVVPSLGPWVPVLLSRVASLLLMPLLARPLKQSVALPPRSTWPMLVAIGIIDTVANVGYNLGVRSDAPGVVAVLGSLFSPITVILAFVLLRERLSQRQWFGVGLIFAAITLISLVDNIGVA